MITIVDGLLHIDKSETLIMIPILALKGSELTVCDLRRNQSSHGKFKLGQPLLFPESCYIETTRTVYLILLFHAEAASIDSIMDFAITPPQAVMPKGKRTVQRQLEAPEQFAKVAQRKIPPHGRQKLFKPLFQDSLPKNKKVWLKRRKDLGLSTERELLEVLCYLSSSSLRFDKSPKILDILETFAARKTRPVLAKYMAFVIRDLSAIALAAGVDTQQVYEHLKTGLNSGAQHRSLANLLRETDWIAGAMGDFDRRGLECRSWEALIICR